MASSSSRDEERPIERAVRLRIQTQGGCNEALDPQPSEPDSSTDPPRLKCGPVDWGIYHRARKNDCGMKRKGTL